VSEIEDKVLAEYSTPGLKKCELDRRAKKDQLDGLKLLPVDRDEILEKLFGKDKDARSS
jgi:hypothetical protein